MKRLVLALAVTLLPACNLRIPMGFGSPCQVVGVRSVLIPDSVSCSIVQQEFTLASQMLGDKYPGKALTTTDIYFLDRDSLVMSDGKLVAGYYDQNHQHIVVMRDGAALLHELLHLYREMSLGISNDAEVTHAGWDAAGLYKLDSLYEQAIVGLKPL